MYYQNYEDYMRSMLGYPNPSGMEMPTYMAPDDYYIEEDTRDNIENYENMYPEIYRIVYPMVCKACDDNTKPITEETIDEMTNIIFVNLEASSEQVNVKMELKNGDVRNPNAKQEIPKETRQNNTLRDLIRILLIRELLRRRHGRPPMRPRPPFPGGPGRPLRPPFPGGMGRSSIPPHPQFTGGMGNSLMGQRGMEIPSYYY